MKLLKPALIAALLSMSAASHAATNIVVNGGFEADSIGGNAWSLLNSVTGWSSTGPFEIQKGNDTGGFAAFNSSYEGIQYLELNSTTLTTVSQQLSTVDGGIYNLSFAYSGRSDTPNSLKSSVEVYWGGQKLVASKVSAHSDWIEYSFDDLAGYGESTLLSFKSTGPISASSYGSYLDGVIVNRIDIPVTPVPEPSTYGMLFVGLGMLGFLSRRRKSN